ncbi:unnamed protein product [Ascophyllum nodosum]
MTPETVPTFMGPLVRSRNTKPTPTYFEISFLNNDTMESPPRLDAIVFRNFYCSHITIKQHKQIEGAPGVGKEAWVWATILRDRPVMEDPHHEDDAQYWHVVAVEEFSQEYDADSAAPLRIYLYQPSPMWKTFALQHVKCIRWSRLDSRAPEEELRSPVGREIAPEADLADLCRGISEQVQIFGGTR